MPASDAFAQAFEMAPRVRSALQSRRRGRRMTVMRRLFERIGEREQATFRPRIAQDLKSDR
jgi:hypothetical protein